MNQKKLIEKNDGNIFKVDFEVDDDGLADKEWS
jgi:hypothetical protein